MAFGKKKESREVEGYMKLTPKSALIYLAIIVFCIIVISPLVIVFSSSLRSPGNQASPLMLFSEFTLASYKQAFSSMNYPMELINSILTTGGSVLCVVIFATMAAYPIGRIKTKTAKFLYYFFISGLIIPSQMVIVPIAQTLNRLGIPNTRFTPMIMFITCSLPFSVFLFSGFMKGVPKELEEAAKIDGCNAIKTLWYVIVPMLKPSLVSCALFQFMWTSNDFMGPLIYISDMEKYTNSIYLRMSMDGDVGFQWNRILAMSLISIIPSLIVFFCAQDSFIDGIAAGGVKG